VFTARFRIPYVLVIMELGLRQILHHNVTAHPSAEMDAAAVPRGAHGGTCVPFSDPRPDSIFSKGLDKTVTTMGVRLLRHRCIPLNLFPSPKTCDLQLGVRFHPRTGRQSVSASE
jgi:hypothetical protein